MKFPSLSKAEASVGDPRALPLEFSGIKARGSSATLSLKNQCELLSKLSRGHGNRSALGGGGKCVIYFGFKDFPD